MKTLLIFLLAFLLLGCEAIETEQQQESTENNTVIFNKCTDGDTAHFYINGTDETVRFLGIDTPETVDPDEEVEEYGKEASDYTCQLLTNATTITLEYEEEMYDAYDRVLAWVFVDGELLQEKLVLEGLAEVAYIYGDYKYTDVLYDAQEVAKQNKINLWSE